MPAFHVEYDKGREQGIEVERNRIIKLINESVDWYKVKMKTMGIGEAKRFCNEFKKCLEELEKKINEETSLIK